MIASLFLPTGKSSILALAAVAASEASGKVALTFVSKPRTLEELICRENRENREQVNP